MLFNSCFSGDNNSISKTTHWFTSCESTNKKDNRIFFSDGIGNISASSQINQLFARTGKSSLLMLPSEKYALSLTINDSKIGDYYIASVWFKNDSTTPILCGVYNNTFVRSNESIKTVGEWNYLEIRTHLTEEAKSIKFYIHKPNKDSIFLDDLHVYRLPNESVFLEKTSKSIQHLNIKFPKENTIKAIALRKQAYTQGLQNKSTKKWLPIKINNQDAKMRFKGDWLDHLSNYKWSYRIKQDSSLSFSITNPISRGFLGEYINQAIMRSQDLLTTNYRYSYISYNDSLFGLYGIEDHFSKSLIKTWKFGEGDILKFDESDLWLVRSENKGKDRVELNYLDCAGIESYTNRNNENNFNEIARNLDEIKFGNYNSDSIFDIDYMAKYIALIDLFEGYHGTIWHNIRFYRNKASGKLYPIAFDLTTDKKNTSNKLFIDDIDHPQVFTTLLNNHNFKLQYYNNLIKYSSNKFIESVDSILGVDYCTYKNAFFMEYDSIWIQTDDLSSRAQYIRERIQQDLKTKLMKSKFSHFEKNNISDNYQFHPNISVKAYNQGNNQILIQNFFNKKIKVLEIQSKDGKTIFNEIKTIPAFKIAGKQYPYLSIKTKNPGKYLKIIAAGEKWTITISKKAYPISF